MYFIYSSGQNIVARYWISIPEVLPVTSQKGANVISVWVKSDPAKTQLKNTKETQCVQ